LKGSITGYAYKIICVKIKAGVLTPHWE